MTHSVVPLELHYRIIDLLWYPDPLAVITTLQSCALTCRAYLNPSRRRLFRRFVLRHTRPQKLAELVRFITTSPDVFDKVEQLVIGGYASAYEIDSRIGTSPTVIALILAGKFPRLRSLTLKMPLTSSLKEVLMLATLPMVTKLNLQEGWFESFGALQKALSLLPSLLELRLAYPALHRAYIPSIPPSARSIPLRLPKLIRLDYVTPVRN